MNLSETPNSEVPSALSPKDENLPDQKSRSSLPLGEKDDNIKDTLKQKLDFKTSGTNLVILPRIIFHIS